MLRSKKKDCLNDRFEKIISYLKKCLSNFIEKKYKTAKVI